jgi:integrase
LYYSTIKKHLKPFFGDIPLQKLSPLHVERYYAQHQKLAPATVSIHHSILATALKAAVTKGILRSNAASRAANKPHIESKLDDLHNVWSSDDARRFITTVKKEGTVQDAALFSVLLDAGLRKSECLGLKWTDVQGNKLRVERQLNSGGRQEPTFILPKRGGLRTVDLSDETVALLQAHKRVQSELKMQNRKVYRDHSLIFAQTWELVGSNKSFLGAPLHESAINKRLKELCTRAGVPQITPHGLRHTCATLLLAAGVQPHVVQRRLGHKKIEITLNIYSHVMPSMQEDAAKRLATQIHGTKGG